MPRSGAHGVLSSEADLRAIDETMADLAQSLHLKVTDYDTAASAVR